jgi:hypothetical protein
MDGIATSRLDAMLYLYHFNSIFVHYLFEHNKSKAATFVTAVDVLHATLHSLEKPEQPSCISCRALVETRSTLV